MPTIGPLRFDYAEERFFVRGSDYRFHAGDVLWLHLDGAWKRCRIEWDQSRRNWYVVIEGEIIYLEPDLLAAVGEDAPPPSVTAR